MGLISSDIDDDFKEAKATTTQKLEPGVQEATIAKLELITDKAEIKANWIDIELVVTFEGEGGGKAWHRIEVMPCTLKDGTRSPGKLGYLKGQLENMGYTGKLSELEYALAEMRGAKCRINIEDKEGDKINPKTGKKYVNREVYVQELIKAGVGTTGGLEEASADFVPAPAVASTDDDDDLPF